MYKLSSVLVAFLFVFSYSVSANPLNFKGSWKGEGTYVLENNISHCTQFNMVFDATESTFSFVEGERLCEDHEEKFFRVDMQYRDGKLFFGDQVVGSYTENTLEAAFRIPDGDNFRNWRMKMRVTGDQLLYEESRIYDGEDTPFINFAGIMIAE